MKVNPPITKAHIDQLEREIMALVPRGKLYATFKQRFNDFREATEIGAYPRPLRRMTNGSR